MQCALKCKIEFPAVSTVILKSKSSSHETHDGVLSIDLSPPVTVDEKVNFNKDVMKAETWYPFIYKNNRYLAVKTSDKTIEIYKVKK